MKVNGVNLGNWLVLEKWMSPGLFEGTDAADEYWLPRSLTKEVYEARILTHRSEYITERDFVTIKSWGMDTIRIPVPYFVFGDRKPFLGCINELDQAFNWAEKYGLKILIDLHTAPEGQNGFDNGGISGVCKWAQNPQEVEFVLTVLERLAKRYGTRNGLWGIEVLNEPATEAIWELMNVQKRYPPKDETMGKGSCGIPISFIKQFYREAYKRIRAFMSEEKHVIFHDAFDLSGWKEFFEEDNFQNIVLDTHQYLMMAEMMGCGQNLNEYLDYIQTHFAKEIEKIQEYVPVICGEWCLFNSLACGWDTKGGQTVLNGVEGSDKELKSAEEKKEIYQAVAKAQLEAWNKGSGHFYWSYKLLTDTVNTSGWSGWDSWDLGRCVDFGWFPVKSKI
ncbi:glycoside hydrolase family 5 protein [Lacrimispora sp. AGF001]|uniref:glycoside hydrolase family 5 protein n=1 Tax=Lacrimispora sp. AGF001 TaxID=3401631 RepID=UPI003B43151E